MIDLMIKVLQHRRIPDGEAVPQPYRHVQRKLKVLCEERGYEILKRQQVNKDMGPRRYPQAQEDLVDEPMPVRTGQH